MAQSLLAHLYSRIRGSQEDVATYSIQYILSQSEPLNNSFIRLISSKLKIDTKKMHFICQAVGENQERPDMAGIDPKGNELVLGEAKFYAGLTVNQPNTYLDRIIENGGLGLFFICPKKRKSSLWRKIVESCEGRAIADEQDDFVRIDGVPMTILTWDEILLDLYNTASISATDLVSDIGQLKGFCDQMDSTAFIPFEPEDFGPDMARKTERYYEVVDATIDRLCEMKELKASKKGLKAAPSRRGYARYIFLPKYGVGVQYNWQYWMDSDAEVPLWLSIGDENWEITPKIQRLFDSVPQSEKYDPDYHPVFALHIPTNATLDEITESLCRQIVAYLDRLKGKNA